MARLNDHDAYKALKSTPIEHRTQVQNLWVGEYEVNRRKARRERWAKWLTIILLASILPALFWFGTHAGP